MPRNDRVRMRRTPPLVQRVLQPPDTSLLDVLDHLLDKGVVADGEVTLGVAGVDLIYLRLAAILCAADRVLPSSSRQNPKRARRRRRRRS
ncbi:MAG TPA: gas vesicle protein GvpJ [Vicinamibacterales bacterium]|jgi:gas vesicle protein GvpA/GvpJ/GvpM family|nr:gas vesicle protein GvpJ [Vicinamibacterales bacterium]